MEFCAARNPSHVEEEISGGRREAHAKGERWRRPVWVDRPNGSVEPVWAPLGLPFGQWVPAGVTASGLGVPQILRLEGPEMAKARD
jgi:hypothetical protein